MLRRLLTLVLTGVLLAGLGLGCGGDGEKGIHNNRDRPRAADHGER
ncbi:MAG TPA: hypothetical protein VNK04_20565 [Gemmataceae bacterium]|nr:hypothetical protein [Gemmataceae bacterium]